MPLAQNQHRLSIKSTPSSFERHRYAPRDAEDETVIPANT